MRSGYEKERFKNVSTREMASWDHIFIETSPMLLKYFWPSAACEHLLEVDMLQLLKIAQHLYCELWKWWPS